MSSQYIYLDNAATVRPSAGTIEELAYINSNYYFNPSARYNVHTGLSKRMDDAKQSIAERLGVDKSTLCFTSGATEANNWAITKGHKNKKGAVVTSMAEHPSVYNVVKSMESSGSEALYLELDSNGAIDIASLQCILAKHSVSFVSVIHVCGQTGAINNIKQIVQMIRLAHPKAIIHSDGVQAFGKLSYSLLDMDVDLYTISMHKIGGLKGLGVLYIKRGVNIAPMILGGAQQMSHRAGTENTPAILSSVQAIHDYCDVPVDYCALRRSFLDELNTLDGVTIHGNGVPHIITLSIAGIMSEILQSTLCDKGVIIGIGSACNARHSDNRILASMGLDKSVVQNSIRISFGNHNTIAEVRRAAQIIVKTVQSLRC